MASLHLKIVTPEQEVFEGEAEEVYAQTKDGEIGILPGHVNLMAQIIPGELRIKKNGNEEYFAVGSGLLQVSNNELTIATDLAEKPAQIDEQAVEEAKKRAETAMSQVLSDEEYAETVAVLEKSLIQLKMKRRRVHI